MTDLQAMKGAQRKIGERAAEARIVAWIERKWGQLLDPGDGEMVMTYPPGVVDVMAGIEAGEYRETQT